MRKAKRLSIDPAAIGEALEVLNRGGVVAFPTDTVYGVGADVRQPKAIAKLYEIKERPLDKAIPLLLARTEDMASIAQEVPESAWHLAERFWPGALTMVMRRAPSLPSILTASGPTVAVRVPDHPVARSLIEGLGAPLAATSANISGQPSPVTADDVLAQLGGRIELLLDGGPCPGGEPSTVVDLTLTPARILRPGPITADHIRAVLSLA
ncbi:MAG: L-threonylcarbamoyladenylate synthase [Chloroflexota bacterium]|nr:L-threonylcarbamoyladenylate synthase [Chloroflexota bacterium]